VHERTEALRDAHDAAQAHMRVNAVQ